MAPLLAAVFGGIVNDKVATLWKQFIYEQGMRLTETTLCLSPKRGSASTAAPDWLGSEYTELVSPAGLK